MQDEVGELVYTWSMHISKHGNIRTHGGQIAVKYAKNQTEIRDEVGGLVYTWSVHISKYGNIGNHQVKVAAKYAKKNQKKMRDRLES
jgi:hypothetical protein